MPFCYPSIGLCALGLLALKKKSKLCRFIIFYVNKPQLRLSELARPFYTLEPVSMTFAQLVNFFGTHM